MPRVLWMTSFQMASSSCVSSAIQASTARSRTAPRTLMLRVSDVDARAVHGLVAGVADGEVAQAGGQTALGGNG
ncbi:hypothetical protein Z951_42120 [Streptomyces sp. PRh5]|nr:hypothetical protein Z951_42120 [Streptomyces sp. PRh5]